MSVVSEPTVTVIPIQKIVLSAVSWDIYAALRELSENDGKFMTYDGGQLEIMTHSRFHERVAQLVARFVDEWTVANDISIASCGNLTFQRKDLEKGLEPDKCYYIQHESFARGEDEFDFLKDPPPDLVLEVDHTARSLKKMPIYQAMGVPELWRWNEEELTIWELVEGQYQQRERSIALPSFPFDALMHALQRRHQVDETTLIREFRQSLIKP
jgi:Uma2 family endonuclease